MRLTAKKAVPFRRSERNSQEPISRLWNRTARVSYLQHTRPPTDKDKRGPTQNCFTNFSYRVRCKSLTLTVRFQSLATQKYFPAPRQQPRTHPPSVQPYCPIVLTTLPHWNLPWVAGAEGQESRNEHEAMVTKFYRHHRAWEMSVIKLHIISPACVPCQQPLFPVMQHVVTGTMWGNQLKLKY